MEKDTVMTHRKVKSANLADQHALLYPSGTLFRFIRQLENLITSCSSTQGLHHESVTDILCLTRQKTNMQTVCLLLMKLQCAKSRTCHFPSVVWINSTVIFPVFLWYELIPQSPTCNHWLHVVTFYPHRVVDFPLHLQLHDSKLIVVEFIITPNPQNCQYN